MVLVVAVSMGDNTEAQARWDPASRHTRSTRGACADLIWNSLGAQYWAISRRTLVLPARFPRN